VGGELGASRSSQLFEPRLLQALTAAQFVYAFVVKDDLVREIHHPS
jgi:hypothetical protein